MTPSSPAAVHRMKRQARWDTQPELAVRRLLHSRGLRYRIQVPVPGMTRRSMDISFQKARLAVFVDGCFWHGCPDHGTFPHANATWWRDKISRNQLRDQQTTDHLCTLGWTVLRFWTHESVTHVADVICAVLQPNTAVNVDR